MIPARRKTKPMGMRAEVQVRSDGHCQWIRGNQCSVAKQDGRNCAGKIECAHVRTGTDGGMGLKPGDNWTIPLCAYHHEFVQHQIGEPAFEKRYGIDMKKIAAALWQISPHRISYERKQQDLANSRWSDDGGYQHD